MRGCVRMDERAYTFKEYLEQNGRMTYYNKGVSMLPMLRQGRDLITVVKKGPERCRKYDVILFDRPPNDHVLHRVVEVRDGDYGVLGDNCWNVETVREDQIVGVLESFTRSGRTISVGDPLYRAYSVLRVFFYPVRKLRWRAVRKIRKILGLGKKK